MKMVKSFLFCFMAILMCTTNGQELKFDCDFSGLKGMVKSREQPYTKIEYITAKLPVELKAHAVI